MVHHLVKARSAYKDKKNTFISSHFYHILSHIHTTNTWITGEGLVEWEGKTNDPRAC